MSNTLQQWQRAGAAFIHPRVLAMLFLGFSAGIPILLIFSSLSLWLREAGLDRSTVTFFSWAALGYSFKFVWAPLIDHLPLPLLTRWLGRRRAWLLVAQLAIIAAILWMAVTDPVTQGKQLEYLAMAAVLLGFSSATQDIVIDAYRIEAADEDSQPMMSSTYVAGYRIGMLVAGAGALFLASYWGSDKGSYNFTAWSYTYMTMAAVMLIGIATTFVIPEPGRFQSMRNILTGDYALTLIALLFAGNELANSLADGNNIYQQSFVWFVRTLLITSVLLLLRHQRKADNQSLIQYQQVKLGYFAMTIVIAYWLINFLFDAQQTLIWVALLLLTAFIIGSIIRRETHLKQEPFTENTHAFTAIDYGRFLLLFALTVCVFVGTYLLTQGFIGDIKETAQTAIGNKPLAGLLIEGIRLFIAIGLAISSAIAMVKLGIANRTMVQQTYIAPVKDFFLRYGKNLALLLLLLVGFYRISDIVLGVISNVFYQDLGFTKPEIASIVKTFGLIMTILGGFLGGILATRYGIFRILFLGALLSAFTNLLFMVLANLGHNLPMLYLVISADNLSAGLASAAFIAFLSTLTNIKFTAIQYAIFSSVMLLLPKAIGGYSGSMVDSMGYGPFFFITFLMGIPVLILIWLLRKKI
ncbi:MAG: AmpG permease [uncultured Thiotrichaceae bacterium]|uniref:AmpG permease n=1 Tax=uncultured Thiotrichaceae bacterium TaxID=298394 RepID=A0A6S6SGA2_9GAMM|nr:MAG: AmpG permease [uncultured Thiotrichaceae bacterium]